MCELFNIVVSSLVFFLNKNNVKEAKECKERQTTKSFRGIKL
jgi:hypothetical protein